MDNNWRAQRECNPSNAYLFIGDGRFRKHVARAKVICKSCRARPACLEDGLREPAGVWGGMDETERIAERRRRGMPDII